MSLENKLGEPGGDFYTWLQAKTERTIEAVDEKYLYFYSWLAETWQNKTYRDKANLEVGAWLAGFTGFGADYATGTSRYPSLVGAGVCGLLAILIHVRGQDEEKAARRMEERLTTPEKFVDALILTYGAAATAANLATVAVGYVAGDSSLYLESLQQLSRGVACFSMASGIYLLRVNPGDPPRRPQKKSLTEKLREALEYWSSPPAPQPAKLSPTIL